MRRARASLSLRWRRLTLRLVRRPAAKLWLRLARLPPHAVDDVRPEETFTPLVALAHVVLWLELKGPTPAERERLARLRAEFRGGIPRMWRAQMEPRAPPS